MILSKCCLCLSLFGLWLVLLMGCVSSVPKSNPNVRKNVEPKRDSRKIEARTGFKRKWNGLAPASYSAPQSSSLNRVSSQRMMGIIEGFLGIPYKFGGDDRRGMDCSGFVKIVFLKTENKKLPHNAAALFKIGESVEKENLSFGDVVFFNLEGEGISHCGIYLKQDLFVHASRKHGVSYGSLDHKIYLSSYVGAKRLTNAKKK